MQAGPINHQHMLNRELLLEMAGNIRSLERSHKTLKKGHKDLQTSQENQQGTLQLLSLLTDGLLSSTRAQSSQLAAVYAHQLTHEVSLVVMGTSASPMPSPHGPSINVESLKHPRASKAVRLSLKRTQQWESCNFVQQA